MSDLARSARRGALVALGLTMAALVGCGSGSSGGVVSSVTTVSGSVASGSGGLPLLVAGATHGATTGIVVILELSDGRRFTQSVAAGIRQFSIGVQNGSGLGARILIEYNGQVIYQDILGPLGTGAINRQQVGPASTLVALLASKYLGIAITSASNLTSLALPGGGTLDLNALRQRVDQNPSSTAFTNLLAYLARIANGTATCSLADLASGSCSDAAIGSLLSDITTLANSNPAPKTTGGSGGANGSATLVSIGTGGTGQGGGLAYPRPSTTGQFVAWSSYTDGDLVPGDSNGKIDCFVRDVTGMTTERVSVATAGQPDDDCFSADISGDGMKVVYVSKSTNAVSPSPTTTNQAYLYNRGTTTTTLLSQVGGTSGNQTSSTTRISQDGNYACFVTRATNLGLTGTPPFLVRVHTGTGVLNQIMSPSAGNWDDIGECSLSGDGAKVAFNGKVAGSSDNRAYVSTVGSSITTPSDVTPAPAGPLQNGRVRISADGNFVCWAARQQLVPGDTDTDDDIYVRNLGTSALEHVSVNESGANVSGFAADCSISSDGRYVTFTANQPHVAAVTATGVNHVYVRDRTGATTKVLVGAQADGSIDSSTISPDGSKVVFVTGHKLDAADQPGPWHFDAYIADRP